MKKTYNYTYILLAVIFVMTACYKETPMFIKADFETSFVNDDESVPVQISIRNKTEGADTYEWTFEGATVTSSTDKNPGGIEYTKAGTYTITLKVSNVDGLEETLTKEITVVEGIDIQFSTETIKSNYPPVEVKLTNNTVGENLTYQWTFEGGKPAKSTDKNPTNIVFEEPGKHRIQVAVSNGFETITKEEIITVLPDIDIDFDWEVDFFDDDYQAPVTITLQNKTTDAISYQWTFEGGAPSKSIEENPEVTFQNIGTYTIKLIASNGKTEKITTKTIQVKPNTNLRTFTDVKLGINSAHSNNNVGAFFSTELRKTFTANEVTTENGYKIDLVFLGLSNGFTYNKFLSPTEAGSNGFVSIPNAQQTKLINSQESCSCGVSFSVAQFDAMNNDTPLQTITITETPNGLLHFDNTMKPRIVLFQTVDGRKGAIKIKEFVDNGSNSYILCDIKVQKLP
ncbi:PKD domain-containing protein [Tenacibaculum sp. ZH5_bin.1]|uniref:PKD domain-containing protein n=1 Tax=Tenacibaculum TaxID=104267 RepID=UPI001431F12F|nr:MULTISPECIES: PKD domain-containing protein [Tenacibaculum]KAF9660118.1 PKD domain-containing protein [Tenacibaculum mesophilum]MCO7184906.1 PKD domain-containing protein [Tenacibaculum sp. XPcli2-G]